MLRLLVSPRWLTWHVLTLGAMVTCGFLAAWQWGRAGSAMGSAVNVGYGLQWPLFAVFFGYMWWRFLRMEAAALRAAHDGAPDGSDAAGTAGAGAAKPASTPRGQEFGSEAAADAEQAPERAGHAAVAGSPGPGSGEATAAAKEAVTRGAVPARDSGAARGDDGSAPRRSPFTPRPAGVAPARYTDPQLRAYNVELARLADRHREETST